MLALALILVFGSAQPVAEPTSAGGGPAIDETAFFALLDGRTFVVDYGPASEPSRGEDALSFAGGLFSSAACVRIGFAPASYWLRVEADGIRFHAEMTSEAHGRLVFSGRINGDEIEAESLWTRQRWYRTVVLRSWYKGSTAHPDQPLPVKS